MCSRFGNHLALMFCRKVEVVIEWGFEVHMAVKVLILVLWL
jgi:hypothetical protein